MSKTLQEQMADAARGALGTGIEGNSIATTKVAQRYALEQQIILLHELFVPQIKDGRITRMVNRGTKEVYQTLDKLNQQLEQLNQREGTNETTNN